jgi:hypothetical protein
LVSFSFERSAAEHTIPHRLADGASISRRKWLIASLATRHFGLAPQARDVTPLHQLRSMWDIVLSSSMDQATQTRCGLLTNRSGYLEEGMARTGSEQLAV